MRIFHFVVALILVLSTSSFAQHGGGGSSGGGGGGSHGSSGGSSGGGSHSSGGGGGSHSSSGGSHSGSHSGSGHAAGGHASSGHASGNGAHSRTSTGASTHTAGRESLRTYTLNSRARSTTAHKPNPSHEHIKESGASRAKPEHPEKRGFFSFLRHPFKPKPGMPPKKPSPNPGEPDLRHRVCLNAPCGTCPPGQARGKNGACGAPPSTANSYANACSPNEPWNITSCEGVTSQCRAGMRWNGTQCVVEGGQCAAITGQAAALANEIRAAKSRMQMSCSGSSPAQDCGIQKQLYDDVISRYRMLMNATFGRCRAGFIDPLAF